MLTSAMFRHELIRAVKAALPKDRKTELSRDMVEDVQRLLGEKLSAAWKLTYPARKRRLKR